MRRASQGTGRRFVDVVMRRPLRGGLTGIALVTLATLVLAGACAVVVALALWLLG